MQYEKSPRDHGIITIFLNCALRLSELASLNIDQVDNEVISVVGKGNKERRIYLTPAAKKLGLTRFNRHIKRTISNSFAFLFHPCNMLGLINLMDL
ncbi:tyrosine-type recombinase/integrase [Desulfosporosinus sp. SB140]|uniref:tyrosine-type recombinase/integrase n=1 Tax=Desulfosporosinus paludis TaxID=3115649 RepID=UPI003890BC6B